MAEVPMTRRMLLERLSVMGGAALMMAGMEAFGYGIASARPAPPALTGGAKGKKLVVLGAGVAGLATAIEAIKAGYAVQIVEARSFAGGRAQTARKGFSLTELGGEPQTCDFDDGGYINHGPWRIPFHHRSTLHYARTLNVPLEVFINDNDHSYVFFENGTGPLKAKAVRKAQVAADIRGHAAEMLAKVVKKGGLDDQVTAADRDMLIAYLINEGYLSPKDLDYSGTEGRGWDIEPGAGVDPGPGKPSTPFSMIDVLHSGAWRTLRRSLCMISRGPCSSLQAAWTRSPRRWSGR